MLDQISQDAKCLRRQANPLIISMIPVTPETLVDGVQPERRKLLHAERAVLCPSMLYPYNQVEAVVSHEKTPLPPGCMGKASTDIGLRAQHEAISSVPAGHRQPVSLASQGSWR